ERQTFTSRVYDYVCELRCWAARRRRNRPAPGSSATRLRKRTRRRKRKRFWRSQRVFAAPNGRRLRRAFTITFANYAAGPRGAGEIAPRLVALRRDCANVLVDVNANDSGDRNGCSPRRTADVYVARLRLRLRITLLGRAAPAKSPRAW